MTTINQDYLKDYFKVNRMDSDKLEFLEEFSDIERRVMRIMFLRLKLDILEGLDNLEITTIVKKKIKKYLEKQLEIFDKIYDDFINDKNYRTIQDAKVAKITFKECLKKSLTYYSFLKLIWEENEVQLIILSKMTMNICYHSSNIWNRQLISKHDCNVFCRAESITVIILGVAKNRRRIDSLGIRRTPILVTTC